MNKKLAGSLAATLFMGAGSANALLIDSFDAGLQDFSVAGPPPNSGNDSAAAGLGGSRLIGIDVIAGTEFDETRARVVGGFFDVQNSAAANADVSITWDGIGGADLTEGGTAAGLFLSFPAAIDNALTVTFEIDGSILSNTFPDGSVGTDIFIDFSSFSDPAALTDVDSIKMTMSDGAGWDARIDLVETRPQIVPPPPPPPPPGVPEPTTLALLGLGLFGLGYGHRKSQS